MINTRWKYYWRKRLMSTVSWTAHVMLRSLHYTLFEIHWRPVPRILHIDLTWFSLFPSPDDVVLHCCQVPPLPSLSAHIRSIHAISSSQTGHACCLLHPVCTCATESIYETNFYLHTYDKSGTSHLLPDFDPSFLSVRMIIMFSSA